MGTPVDFWSLEDCVKGLSELREGRSDEGTIEKANSRARELLRSQMSSYSSSEDAIRQMLAEKERDLELAAQIGSRLLEQNKDLERRLETLDTQLLSANDRAQQLRHELSQKEQLVQVYSQICEEVQGDDVWPSRTPPQPSPKHYSSSLSSTSDPLSSPSDFFSPRNSKRGVLSTGLDQMHMQITLLEEENNRLRQEHDQLLLDRKSKEEKSLVEDCLRQLADANTHIKTLSDDLTKKTDKFMERQVEVGDMIDRSVQMEQRVKQLTNENMALTNRLEDAQGSQMTLSDQLIDLRDKYDQCLSMLSDAHSEIRRVSHQQHQASPCMSANMSPARPPPIIATPTDLATELHASLLAEVEEDDEAPMFLPAVASCSDMPKREDVVCGAVGLRRSSYPWDLRTDEQPLSGSSSASSSGDEDDPGTCRLRKTRKGRAGKHQKSSRRLQQQPQVVSESQRWSPAVRGSSQPLQDKLEDEETEERRPQVQMVKSMEGSTTLKQWQRLARPSMSGALFERRPGVRVRGCSGNRMSGLGGLGGLGGLLGSDDSGEEDKKKANSASKEQKKEKVEEKPVKKERMEKEQEKKGAEKKEETVEKADRVVFGLGGLGMESTTPEPSPRHEPDAKNVQIEEEEEEEEEELMGREVEAITLRMSSAPPDPTRTLDALNHRRAAVEKTSPLAAVPPRSSTPTGNSTSSQKPIALAHHGFSSSNLAAILNEKGIRSKTYEQLVGEGYPVPIPQSTPATQAYPTTPRNSPSEEIEERFAREKTPGPVNPTLVFTGLMESLSEIFKPFGSLTSLRDEENETRGGMRRNTSTGSNLDGLNALAAKPMPVAAVLHRTDTSSASPRKK